MKSEQSHQLACDTVCDSTLSEITEITDGSLQWQAMQYIVSFCHSRLEKGSTASVLIRLTVSEARSLSTMSNVAIVA